MSCTWRNTLHYSAERGLSEALGVATCFTHVVFAVVVGASAPVGELVERLDNQRSSVEVADHNSLLEAELVLCAKGHRFAGADVVGVGDSGYLVPVTGRWGAGSVCVNRD